LGGNGTFILAGRDAVARLGLDGAVQKMRRIEPRHETGKVVALPWGSALLEDRSCTVWPLDGEPWSPAPSPDSQFAEVLPQESGLLVVEVVRQAHAVSGRRTPDVSYQLALSSFEANGTLRWQQVYGKASSRVEWFPTEPSRSMGPGLVGLARVRHDGELHLLRAAACGDDGGVFAVEPSRDVAELWRVDGKGKRRWTRTLDDFKPLELWCDDATQESLQVDNVTPSLQLTLRDATGRLKARRTLERKSSLGTLTTARRLPSGEWVVVEVPAQNLLDDLQ